MKYIAIIHKEQGTAYGVTLPDFPGCFSAADTLDEVPRNIGGTGRNAHAGGYQFRLP